MEDILEKSMIKMLMENRFFAEVLLRLKRHYTTEIPTLGVGIKDDSWNLYVNPHFFKSLTILEQVDVLKHEVHHILNCHFDREKLLEPEFDRTAKPKSGNIYEQIQTMMNATRLNIAEDIAINEYLPNLPKKFKVFDKEGNPIKDEQGNIAESECCSVENLKKQYPDLTKIESKQMFEYYYHIMKDQEKEDEKNGKGQKIVMVTIDDHDSMNPGNVDKEYVKDLAKKVVNAAAEATRGSMAGNIPGDIESMINKLNYKPKDWRSDLRKFASKACEAIVEVTRKKRNRRYGMLFAGHTQYPQLHLVVSADSSGSVSDEYYTQFMAELDGISQAGAKITFIECDAEIQYVGKFDPKKKLTVKGRGGTLVEPIFKLVNSKEFVKKYGEFDGLIHLSDMEIFDMDKVKKAKFPVLWAGTKGSKKPATWGNFTEIEIRKKG